MERPAPRPETTGATAPALAAPAAAAAAPSWWAVCLCAQWCGTCRDYRPLFDALARAHPEVRFEWVDIEDAADLAGDLDVETFPTLLIGHEGQAVFLGPLLPQAPVLGRLLTRLRADGAGAPRAGAEAQAVLQRVLAARGG